MKFALAVICAIAVAVVALPTEKPDGDHFSGAMSDLIQSINKIQNNVKGMRALASGNHTDLEKEVMDEVGNLSKNVTYENLIDRVQQASVKVQELQKRLSNVLTDLSKKYPRPDDKTEKTPAVAA